jgi:alpha-L-fucosidase 2
MNRSILPVFALLTISVCTLDAEHVIRQDRPARDWQSEALPIGNGRLGCMIFGGVGQEHIQFNEDTLWIGDESDTGAFQAFGDLYIQFGPYRGEPGISNPSNHATSSGQSVEKTIDGNPDTKWCMEHKGQPVVWQITFPDPPGVPLQSYVFTSAEDVPTRDPRTWVLEGSLDGREWTVLDERNLDDTFPERHFSKRFDFQNNQLFSIYRFTFQPTDKTHFQVAEIRLGDSDPAFVMDPANETSGPYHRELNIDQSVHSIEYEKDGTTFTRTYFASNPANVLVFHLAADKPAAYSGSISLADAHDAEVKSEGNMIWFSGALTGKYNNPNENYDISLNYEAQAMVLNRGGRLENADGKILFQNCDSLTILLDAGTDYLNQRENGWKQEHPHRRISQRLAKASKRSVQDLLSEHIEDYHQLFNRVTLDIGNTSKETLQLSTPQRLDAYQKGGADPDLEELLFQYARYLMISSSRPGCMPANLQGLWNNSNHPAWRCDYHTDVNIEMNYWFVDQANLSECFLPLSEWLHSIIPVRRETTRKEFGVRGWMTRSENGIFGGATYHWVPGDAAWVAQNIWDHYAFTMDEDYLKNRAYPIIKELCECWEDYLIEWPDGSLVSPKSQSPEHGPWAEGNSYEQQLVYDLFTNYIEASIALDVDADFREKVESMRSRLLGPQIGRWGQLQEWAEDIDDPKDQHRHLSHLIAVHPGRQISPLTTPELAEAAKVSMNARGDGATGWSKAWKINIWARLQDGNRAYKLLGEQIRGNYFDNLFGFHPPFQIDGNFGYASGVCEMLLQSHMGFIQILPALPDAWADGKVTGLKARGGFVVDLEWKEGKLTQAAITSLEGSPLHIKYGDIEKQMETRKGNTYRFFQ